MMPTAIILAGGKSRRMGRDKCLMPLSGGQEMIKFVTSMFGKLTDKILISANSGLYASLGFPVVKDIYVGCGPLCGLHAALTYSGSELNLVAPCDMPFLTAGFYEDLLQKIEDYDAVVPVFGGRMYPLNTVIKRRVLPHLEVQIRSGDYRVRNLFGRVKTRFVDVDNIVNPGSMVNFNSAKDLETYLKSNMNQGQ